MSILYSDNTRKRRGFWDWLVAPSSSGRRIPESAASPPDLPDAPTSPDPRYWFPAKTYGYGWGLPSTWEGWLVFVGYLAMLALCTKVFPPHRNLLGFIVGVHVLSGLLVAICWCKGEPPKWRQQGELKKSRFN
jgi:hypothetical protein